MSPVDLSALRIDAAATKPKRPLGPRLLAAAVIAILATTGLTFLWPLLRPVRAVPTAPIQAMGAANVAAAGVAVAEAVGWVEPDPFPIEIKPLVSGRIASIDVLEGHEIVAGETVIATLESAELQARYERANAAWAAALAARTVADYEAGKAQAHLEQHAAHRLAIADAEVALSGRQTQLAVARGEVRRLEAEARGAAAAQQAQEQLLAAGTAHPVALERARAAADAADAAVATARDEARTLDAEVAAASARLDLARELKAEPVDLEWDVKIATAKAKQADEAVAVAKAEHTIAVREWNQARQVRSPVSGTVLRLAAHPGATTGPSGQGIITIYDPTKLQARIDVPLDSVAPVAKGQRVALTSEITGRTVVEGIVSRVQHETDLLKNTLQVKIALVDPPAIWRPETLCRARFFGDENAAPTTATEATFAVPSAAVRDGAVYVYDTAAGRARAVSVTVIGADAGRSIVRGELSITQRVITVEVEDGEAVEEKQP